MIGQQNTIKKGQRLPLYTWLQAITGHTLVVKAITITILGKSSTQLDPIHEKHKLIDDEGIGLAQAKAERCLTLKMIKDIGC